MLQAALEVNLVDQDPDDEPASALLERIAAEKEQLVKEKKIKKQNALAPVLPEDVPHEVPESWIWARLSDVTSYGNMQKKATEEQKHSQLWALDLEDVEKDSGRILQKTRAADRAIAGDKTVFSDGDILFGKLRPYLRKVLIANEDDICSSEIVPFQSYCGMEPRYVARALIAPPLANPIDASSYGTRMPRAGTTFMQSLPIPVPPADEQRRVADKLDEVLPLVEDLRKNVGSASTE